MSTYAKLPGDSSSPSIKSLQDLSNCERLYEQKLKELKRLMAESSQSHSKPLEKSILSKQDELINLGNEIRALSKSSVPPAQKQMHEKLKKHAEALFREYSTLESTYAPPTVYEEEDHDVGSEFVERNTLVYRNTDELNSDKLQERHEDIQSLQKDFHEVNSLFKEVASRANVELDSANNYQRSAKKKALIIFIIVLIVVGALIGIVIAATS
jgi:t-SNARE complex subunit (syntaxin)